MAIDLPKPPSAAVASDFNSSSWQNWFFRLYKVVVKDMELSATASLSGFGTIASNGIGTQTITVPGAVTGSPVMLGAPATIEAGLTWSGYVSAANTVTIRLHNTSGGTVTPATNTWSVWVGNL